MDRSERFERILSIWLVYTAVALYLFLLSYLKFDIGPEEYFGSLIMSMESLAWPTMVCDELIYWFIVAYKIQTRR